MLYIISSLRYCSSILFIVQLCIHFCRASFWVQVESFRGTIPWSSTINLLLPSISVFVSVYRHRPRAQQPTLSRGGLKPTTISYEYRNLYPSQCDLYSQFVILAVFYVNSKQTFHPENVDYLREIHLSAIHMHIAMKIRIYLLHFTTGTTWTLYRQSTVTNITNLRTLVPTTKKFPL